MGFACLMAPRINQAVKNSVHKPLLDCRGALATHRSRLTPSDRAMSEEKEWWWAGKHSPEADTPPLPKGGLPDGWTMEQWDELLKEWKDVSVIVVDCLAHRHGPNHGINFRSAFDQATFMSEGRFHVILMHPDGREEDFFPYEYYEMNYQDIETLDDDFQTILKELEDIDSESDRKPRLLDLWMHSRVGKFLYHWGGEGFWGLVILVALVYYFVG